MINALARFFGFSFIIWFLAVLNCCVSIPPPPPTPVPLACDSAATMYTTDWLSVNLSGAQVDALRSQENVDLINRAKTVASVESVFANAGVQDFQSFLVQDLIQKDVVCRVDRSMAKPPYPDSLLLPTIKRATLDFLTHH